MSAPFWARNRARDALEGENALERVAEAIYRTYKAGHEHGVLEATRGTLHARDKRLLDTENVTLHKIHDTYYVAEVEKEDGTTVFHSRNTTEGAKTTWWGTERKTFAAALIDAIVAAHDGVHSQGGDFINKAVGLE